MAKLTKADVRLLGLLGLGVLGNHLFILMELNYVSGAVGGVIIGSSPVVTALLGDVDSPCPAARRVGGRSPVLCGGGAGLSGGVPGRGRSAAVGQLASLFPLALKLFVRHRQLLLHGRIKRPPLL